MSATEFHITCYLLLLFCWKWTNIKLFMGGIVGLERRHAWKKATTHKLTALSKSW